MTGKQSKRAPRLGRVLHKQEPHELKIGDTGKISVGLDRSPTTRTARRFATRSPVSPPELIKKAQIRKGHRWLSAIARQHDPTRAVPPSEPPHGRQDARERVGLWQFPWCLGCYRRLAPSPARAEAEGTRALRSGAGHQWSSGQNRGSRVPPLPAGLLIRRWHRGRCLACRSRESAETPQPCPSRATMRRPV
jgi:hypothetical protein